MQVRRFYTSRGLTCLHEVVYTPDMGIAGKTVIRPPEI